MGAQLLANQQTSHTYLFKQVDRKMKTAIILIAIVGLALADNAKLPVLYRVDQPNSNVVVFRGADVARARAAGLLPGGPVLGRQGKSSPPVAAPAPYVEPAPAPTPAYPAHPAPVYPDVDPQYTWEYNVDDSHYSHFGHKGSRDHYLATGVYYV